MKRIFIGGLLVCFCFVSMSFAGTGNLIINPGMEERAIGENLPANWNVITFKGMETDYKAGWSDNAHQGRKSIFVTWLGGAKKVAAMPALTGEIEGGKEYRVSGYCMTDENGEACFSFETFGKDSKLLQANEFSKKVTKPDSWVFLEWGFTVHLETTQLKLYLMNTGGGKVWFDDIVLQQTGKAVKVVEDFPVRYSVEPVDGNVFWNDNRPVFHSIKDSPVSLSICFWGEKKRITIPRVVFEVPVGINIPEIYSLRLGLSAPYLAPIRLESFTTEEIYRGHKKYVRYTVTQPHALNLRSRTMTRGDILTLCFAADEYIPDREYEIFWHLENGNEASFEERIILKILPPMQKTSNPSNFKGLGFHINQINYYDPVLLGKVLSKYEEANIHGRDRIDPAHQMGEKGKHIHDVDQVMKDRGWLLHSPVHTILLKYKHNRGAVDKKGEESKRWSCPTSFLTNPDAKRAYKKELETRDLAYLEDGEICMLDFEPWQIPKKYCFCEECINNFSKKYGLDREKLTSPEVILKSYRKQWADYWVCFMNEICRQTTAMIKEINPTWKIADYDYLFWFENGKLFSGWDRRKDETETMMSIPKDTRKYEQYIDFHIISVYHNNDKDALELIDNNVKTLKKPVWIMPSLSRSIGVTSGYTKPKEVLTPQQFKVKIIAGASSGAKGLGIYPGDFIDGMYFKTIDQAMAEIAQFEDFYFKGTRQDNRAKLKGLPDKIRKRTVEGKEVLMKTSDWDKYLGLRVHTLKRKMLVTLFNFYKKSDACVEVSLSGAGRGKFTVLDPISGKILAKDRSTLYWTAKELMAGFMCVIPKTDPAYVLIRKYQKRDKELERVYQEDVVSSYEDRSKKPEKREEKTFKPLSKQGVNIYSGFLGEEENMLIVESKVQKIWIDTKKGGQLAEWLIKNDETLICNHNMKHPISLRNMFYDRFWWPQEIRNDGSEYSEYKVISSDISDYKTTIKLENNRKRVGLKILKTFIIDSRRSKVRVNYEIINSGRRIQDLSFWSRHCPKLGIDEGFSGYITMRIPVPGKKRETISGLLKDKKEIVYSTTVEAINSGFSKEKIKGMISEGWVELFMPQSGKSLKFTVDYDKLMQLYSYRSAFLTTEWMYKIINLKPGERWATSIEALYQKGYICK